MRDIINANNKTGIQTGPIEREVAEDFHYFPPKNQGNGGAILALLLQSINVPYKNDFGGFLGGVKI